jgi:hypothetical protein
MQPIPNRPARHQEYNGSHGGTPRVVNGRLTQDRPRPLRMTIMRILRDGTYVSELNPPGESDRDAVTVRVIEYEPVR